MKLLKQNHRRTCGIMLVECIAYIAGLAVVMGLAYGAYYRCAAVSAGMRRNATDISKVLQCGELWREDIRSATSEFSVTKSDEGQILQIPQKSGAVIYAFEKGAVKRSVDGKVWTSLLSNVKASQMERTERKHVVAWRWEVELNSSKGAKLQPLFTFQAVPERQ